MVQVEQSKAENATRMNLSDQVSSSYFNQLPMGQSADIQAHSNSFATTATTTDSNLQSFDSTARQDNDASCMWKRAMSYSHGLQSTSQFSEQKSNDTWNTPANTCPQYDYLAAAPRVTSHKPAEEKRRYVEPRESPDDVTSPAIGGKQQQSPSGGESTEKMSPTKLWPQGSSTESKAHGSTSTENSISSQLGVVGGEYKAIDSTFEFGLQPGTSAASPVVLPSMPNLASQF